MRSITTIAIALAAVAGAPAALSAQAEESRDTVARYELEGVTVTSRRSPALRHDLPQKVEVVTPADLERTVGDGLPDALKETLGVDVIQYPGLLAGVSVRGFRPQFSGVGTRTLILVDGRPAGATNLATLDLAGFESVEVMKGPASALYGSSAMSGVVNLITRSSDGPIGGRIAAGAGSFGGYRGDLTVGGSITPALDFDLNLAAAGREGGYRVGSNRLLGGDSVTKALDAGGTVTLAEVGPDSSITFSDYATRSGSLRLGIDLSELWTAGARIAYFAGDEVQNPGDLVTGWGQTLNDLERRSAEGSIAGTIGSHRVTARAFGSRESTTYYDDPYTPAFVSSRSPVTTRGAQLQDVVALGASSLTFGVDHTDSRMESERFESAGVPAPPYAPDSGIRSTAVFAEATSRLLDGRLIGTLGGRLDRVTASVDEGLVWDYQTWSAARVAGNSERHTVFNPSAGLLARLSPGISVHASGGGAFVTPDPFHLAGYSEVRPDGRRAVRITRGNDALAPESSVGWDAGVTITRTGAAFEADLTYFSSDVRDRIVPVAVQVDGVRLTEAGDTILGMMSYENADRAEIRGLEGRVSYDLRTLTGIRQSLRLFANGTRLLRANELTEAGVRRILNVADLTVVGGIDFDDLRRVGARVSARYVGERRDTDFSDWMNPGELRYPAFVVVDAGARVRVGARLTVSAEVDNLLDENYYEVRGYNLPGRSLRVGASIGF